MCFNYGAFPQTWEDPAHTTPDTGYVGDNDPIDAMEIGYKMRESPARPALVLSLARSDHTLLPLP